MLTHENSTPSQPNKSLRENIQDALKSTNVRYALGGAALLLAGGGLAAAYGFFSRKNTAPVQSISSMAAPRLK